ncbi:MAG: energy transducer TonB [Gemmatimonadales bacterium]
MFDTLPESSPQRKGRARGLFGGTFTSVVFHIAFIFGAIWATNKAAEQVADTFLDTNIVYIEEEEPEPEEPEPVVRSLNPPPKGFQVLAAPIEIPEAIPEIDLTQTFDPRNYTGVGIEGGIFSGEEGGTGPVDLTQVFAEAVVDEPPERISCPAMQYPRMLQQAGIEGSVLLQFVVGADGRVERGSVEIIRSDHRQFERSARDLITRCLFRPGRVRASAVRVLVQMPINFTLGGQ